ncbi:MOSC domain-containing protein [Mesorhizobium sp. M2C.T.Ca.TU.002.02.1.1]|uniref:MOSC domain-containing protein n=1 Tax=Mesorhizobium sp. M2C.T.Ca.TU.002.02.1.1 TaxID=2496788 RepID=UPI000FCA7C5C|nr:MOSC domain-containing protein [Mesorhizobium sp. M2C.T.Ca.TU.002.02.1.1]RUU59359.1 MOSC domain-containing protein [Mesorhizobium sp. M2C.T.Ca.TU.002.02.1.1]
MQETNLELFPVAEPTVDIVPGRKLAAKATALYAAAHDHFETRAVAELQLGFDGIAGDFHGGTTRRSGGREPWYPRGTEMRNERQLSVVAADELAIVAQRMGLEEIKPEWIGANLVIEGVPQLSMLPAGSLLFFKGGVTLKVDGQNKPCRVAGQSIAEHVGAADLNATALLFPKEAKRLRGLVAWVEKPGVIRPGEEISIRVPEQWIYQP